MQAAFEQERAQFHAQFDELSRELREIRERDRRAGGSSRYGEGSRRGWIASEKVRSENQGVESKSLIAMSIYPS